MSGFANVKRRQRTPEEREREAASALCSAEQAERTASDLRAQGNEELAQDYDAMAASFRARAERFR